MKQKAWSLLKLKKQIPLFKVHAPKDIGAVVQKVFDTGMITEGVISDQFETELGDFMTHSNVLLVNSCTSAMTLACDQAGFQEGDEVISSPMTCLASNIPLAHTGAKIVWADINPKTGNICSKSVRTLINQKTKGIIAVHWAGQPFDIDTITEIADEHGLVVIEDAAHAMGARYNGKMIGSHSQYVCFSFQAIKHLSTVDGGALCVKSPEEKQTVRLKRWFGLDRYYLGSRWEQDVTELGYKFHMNNVNAAIGLEQLKFLPGLIQRHIENGKFYDEHIKNTLLFPLKHHPKSESSYWIYSLLCEDRAHFQKYLKDYGIGSDVVHVRNDRYSIFKDCQQASLPGVSYFSSRLINIPVGWWLSQEDKEYIVELVNAYRRD